MSLNSHATAGIVFIGALLSWQPTQAVAEISGISIPVNSQLISRPLMDNVWSVVTQGGTLSTTLGIGIVVDPVWISENDPTDFALHQNQELGSAPYQADHVPDAAASTVTYQFDRPTKVSGVEIVQHVNGVTQVSGVLDGHSLGTVFGPSGDVVTGFVVPGDGISQMFNFGNTTASGKTFRLTVTRSSHFHAFAVHRIFPLDEQGRRIAPASAPATSSPVGGLVHGLSGYKDVVCANTTTGQQVAFTIYALSWNCEQQGLAINAGDVIEQRVRASK